MRRLTLLCLLLLTAATATRAQTTMSGPFYNLYGVGAPSGGCSNGYTYTNSSNGDFYSCNAGTWLKVTGGGGGGLADPGGNGIVVRTALNTTTNRSVAATSPVTVTNADGTAGNPTLACATCTTNAAALTLNQLVFGAGGQATAIGDLTGDVTTAGGKATTAVKINGTSVPTNAAADQVLGTTASATGAWATIANCTDSGGNHLNYTTATHLFSCGTSSSSGLPAHLTYADPTLTVSAATFGSGQIALSGTTSGTATITAPAVAGTSTNGVTFSNVFLAPNGNATNPAYSFSGSTGTGIYSSGSNVQISLAGTSYEQITTGNHTFNNKMCDTAGGTNCLNLSAAASGITFTPNGVASWTMNSSGHLVSPTDNTYDIGAVGATRPRSIFVGTNGTFGGTLSASTLTSTVATGTAPITVTSTTTVPTLVVSNHPMVQFCGTTTSCSHTSEVTDQIVYGSAALVSGTPSTAAVTGISPAFTSSTSYVCTVSAQSTATTALLSVANVSGSAFTITGPATDTRVVNFICVGH